MIDESLHYLSVFKRHWLPASLVFATVFALSLYRTLNEAPIYQATGQILLKKNSTSSLTGVGSNLGQLENSVRGNPLENEAAIIKSIPLAERIVENLNLSQTPQSIVGNLNVTNITGTDILQMSYRDGDPKKAAAIINTLMAVYIENDINANRAETQAARNFIAQQLPLSSDALQVAEQELQEFKQLNRVLDLKAEATATVDILTDLDKQRAATQSELAAQTARVESVRNLFGVSAQEAVLGGIVGESPTTIPALAQLQKIQQEIEVERLRLTDAHPQLDYLKEQEVILKDELRQRIAQSFVGSAGRLIEINDPEKIVQLRPQGLQQGILGRLAEAEAERLSLQVRIQSLDNVGQVYRQRANTLPQLELDQRQLERQIAAKEASYRRLLERYQELQVAENQQVGNARVVTPAVVPTLPMTSRQYMNLVQGLLGGILLAGATVVLLERMDKTVKSPQAARNLLGYPLLSSIPLFSSRIPLRRIPELIVRNAPDSPVSEAFRMLQTNMKFLNEQQAVKVIVVASAVPKEGKSTIASNLAVTMSQLRRRVLLIDGDMRHPTQHEIWDIPNEIGLSSVLLGECEFNQAVQTVMSNVEVLPAGVATLNPVALLDSSQMAVLIAYAEQHYDFVIIDTPPLTVAADATILGKITNGILLVVRPGVADSVNVTFSKELLQQANQNVLGLVVNGVSPKTVSSSYMINTTRS